MFLDLKKDFPQIQYQKNLVYLDSAATTLKPTPVIEKIISIYSRYNSNVHRGSYFLSQKNTSEYEETREVVQKFLNAKEDEVIFTRGTTESINLLSHSLPSIIELNPKDEILLSILEHHANLVPWQVLAKEKDLILKFVPLKADGCLDEKTFKESLSKKTKIISVSQCSNVLGTVTPIKSLVEIARPYGAIFVVDAAQSISSQAVDVQDLNCDFLTFSGHKVFAPYGTGVLYGKKSLLSKMSPFLTGGSMIKYVERDSSSYLDSPYRFEAGTPAVAEIVGLKEAISYLNQVGMTDIKKHKEALIAAFNEEARKHPELIFYDSNPDKNCIFSFNLKDQHSSDIGELLNQQNVAVRTGHLCCQPLAKYLNVSGWIRASFSIYNDEKDVTSLFKSLKKCSRMLL